MKCVFAALALSLTLPAPAFAVGPGCDGEFLRASDGRQWVEGDLEPTGGTRPAGDKLHFSGWDESEGQRFVVADDKTLFAESDVKIAEPCKLKRVERY